MSENWAALLPPAEFLEADAPLIETEDVPTCAVCGSERFATHAVGFDYELRTCRNPWRFVRCRECGHVWLNPRPSVSALGVIYPPTYYAYNYEEQIGTVARRGKELLDRFKLRGILKAAGKPPRSFLDIGCGTGRVLRAMEKSGVARPRIYGIELDQQAVDRLALAGYRAICQRVEACDQVPAASIDLASMFHVIEHVADPAAVVRRVAQWLSPGGLLALETPNVDSLDARWFGKTYWGGYHIPRHWHLFSPETLSCLLAESGLEVVATRYQTGHSFWMYSCHHALRYGAGRRHLSRWFDPFKSLPVLMTFTLFDRLRGLAGFRTSSMLLLARKPTVPACHDSARRVAA